MRVRLDIVYRGSFARESVPNECYLESRNRGSKSSCEVPERADVFCPRQRTVSIITLCIEQTDVPPGAASFTGTNDCSHAAQHQISVPISVGLEATGQELDKESVRSKYVPHSPVGFFHGGNIGRREFSLRVDRVLSSAEGSVVMRYARLANDKMCSLEKH